MKFDIIPKTNVKKFSSYIEYEDKFLKFMNDFEIVGVHWSQPTNISASYFLRVLQEGSSAKPRGYGKGFNKENDESSNQLFEFYSRLFDHCALWKLNNGNVICTAMPYGEKEITINEFCRMKSKFNYPENMCMKFLDDKYRFRSNGDFMIVIFCNEPLEHLDEKISDDELRNKAIQYSSSKLTRYQTTTGSYSRNSYVSEYAKRRAKGICQLCEKFAPFNDAKGNPFLETHHIIRLADGGADSIENTVALCPNCHRKMHILNQEEDVRKLIKVAKEDE